MHRKQVVVGSNPTQAKLFFEKGKPQLKMILIYISKFHKTPMINSKLKLRTLMWRLMNDLSQN